MTAPKAQPPAKLLENALTRHIPVILDVIATGFDPKKLVRMAVVAAERNPKLYECTPTSMLAAVTEAARLGLDIGGTSGEAYLVPRRNRVQLQIGYKGLIRLAERGEKVYRQRAEIVYTADLFSHWRDDSGDHISHQPSLDGDRGGVRGAYAIAYFRNGSFQVEWMNKAELDAIRARSEAGDNGPWVTDYEEMCKKTVLIRLNKDLPLSTDVLKASGLANEAEGGKVMELTAGGEPYTSQGET